MHAPCVPHSNDLKRIIRHPRPQTPPVSIVTYTTYILHGHRLGGDCSDTRQPTSGYCVFLGDNIISWLALHNLLLELHTPMKRAILVYCENVYVVYLSVNPIHYERTKHIEMDIPFVQGKVALGHVRFHRVVNGKKYPTNLTNLEALTNHGFINLSQLLSLLDDYGVITFIIGHKFSAIANFPTNNT
ncbi:hypothetical protein LXL04_032940 [Taraxacum kok-saghyz]